MEYMRAAIRRCAFRRPWGRGRGAADRAAAPPGYGALRASGGARGQSVGADACRARRIIEDVESKRI